MTQTNFNPTVTVLFRRTSDDYQGMWSGTAVSTVNIYGDAAGSATNNKLGTRYLGGSPAYELNQFFAVYDTSALPTNCTINWVQISIDARSSTFSAGTSVNVEFRKFGFPYTGGNVAGNPNFYLPHIHFIRLQPQYNNGFLGDCPLICRMNAANKQLTASPPLFTPLDWIVKNGTTYMIVGIDSYDSTPSGINELDCAFPSFFVDWTL